MTFPTVVAWHYGKEWYHASATLLRAACEEHGYPHLIFDVPDAEMDKYADLRLPNVSHRRWTWRYTAGFVQRALYETERDLLYLHADYYMAHPIPPAWGTLDVAVQRGDGIPNPRPDRIMPAPIFLRWGETARAFVDEWAHRCATVDNEDSEHGHLHDVFFERLAEQAPGIGYFSPDIASPWAESPVPIRGHK